MKIGNSAFMTAVVAMAGLCATSVAHQQPNIGTRRALLEGTSEPTTALPLGGGGGGVCREDTNGDGSINILDLINLLQCFGQPATIACSTGQDINQDGTVNVLDLVALLLAFGEIRVQQRIPGMVLQALLEYLDRVPAAPERIKQVGAEAGERPARRNGAVRVRPGRRRLRHPRKKCMLRMSRDPAAPPETSTL